MKKILLYSTGGFGDALVFTHLATLLQQRLLDVHVDFCINHDFAFQFVVNNYLLQFYKSKFQYLLRF